MADCVCFFMLPLVAKTNYCSFKVMLKPNPCIFRVKIQKLKQALQKYSACSTAKSNSKHSTSVLPPPPAPPEVVYSAVF